MQKSKEFNMKAKNLKLIARTEEDVNVVSAHLQDSIASISNIANLKKNKIFLQVEIVNQNFQKVNELLNSFGLQFLNKIIGRANWIHNYYYKNF